MCDRRRFDSRVTKLRDEILSARHREAADDRHHEAQVRVGILVHARAEPGIEDDDPAVRMANHVRGNRQLFPLEPTSALEHEASRQRELPRLEHMNLESRNPAVRSLPAVECRFDARHAPSALTTRRQERRNREYKKPRLERDGAAAEACHDARDSRPIAAERVARNLTQTIRERADERVTSIVVVGGPSTVAFLPVELVVATIRSQLSDSTFDDLARTSVAKSMNHRHHSVGTRAREQHAARSDPPAEYPTNEKRYELEHR